MMYTQYKDALSIYEVTFMQYEDALSIYEVYVL